MIGLHSVLVWQLAEINTAQKNIFFYSWEGLSMQLYTFTVLFTNWNKAAPHDHLKFRNGIGVGWSHLKCMIACDIAEYYTPTKNEERLLNKGVEAVHYQQLSIR